jgi:hypothetical protein
MTGERTPDRFKWTDRPNVFHGVEYPMHFDFFPAFKALDSDGFYDGMILGFAQLPFVHRDGGKDIKIPRQLLVWDGEGICAMSDEGYRERYLDRNN